MSRENKSFRRPALLSFRFLFTAAFRSVLMGLVAAFGPLSAQLAMLGCFISVLGGLFLSYLGQEDQRERERNAVIENLSVPLTLASDTELFRLYKILCDGLTVVDRGVLIERVVILRDELWPAGTVLPGPAILPWIEDQHNHGLWITLARESEVARDRLPVAWGDP
jgi:hypothetical protein